jgi:hypothetical protein
VEHPPELERLNRLLDAADVVADGNDRGVVTLRARELEQLGAVGQQAVDVAQRADDRVERLLFLAERLGALGIVPDLRVLELAADLGQPRRLDIEVKDTSGAALPAP